MVLTIIPRSFLDIGSSISSSDSKTKIKCSKLYNNQLFLGLSNGHLLIYQLDSDYFSADAVYEKLDKENLSLKFDDFKLIPEELTLVSKVKVTNNENKSVQSIEIIQSLDLLIVLSSSGEVSFHNLRTFEILDQSIFGQFNNVSLIRTLCDSVASVKSPTGTTSPNEIMDSLETSKEELDDQYCESTHFDDSISLATLTLHQPQQSLNQNMLNSAAKSDKSYLIISSKRQLTIFKWLKQELLIKLEYSLSDKVRNLEFLSDQRLIIALMNNEFLSIDLLNNEPNLSLSKLNLPFPSSSNSFFTFNDHSMTYFLNLSFCFLASKDQVAWKLNSFGDVIVYNSSSIHDQQQYQQQQQGHGHSANHQVSSHSQHHGAMSLNNESIHTSQRFYHPHSTKLNPLNFDKSPRFLKFWFPYLISIPQNSNSIEVRSVDTGVTLQVIEEFTSLSNLIDIEVTSNSMIVLTQSNIYKFSKAPYLSQLKSLKSSQMYDDAINLIDKLSPLMFDNSKDSKSGEISPRQLKFLKLRDFQLLKAKALLSKNEITTAMHLFTEFMASPDLVINSLPETVIALLHDTKKKMNSDEDQFNANVPIPISHSNSNRKTLNKKASKATLSATSPTKSSSEGSATDSYTTSESYAIINSLMPYLTDCRRKLARLLDLGSPKFQWRGITISSDFYVSQEEDTESDEYSHHNGKNGTSTDKLLKLAELVDTTLFQCYILTAPRMAGPLLRLNNYCRPDEIEKQLKSLNMYRELIDFYYSKSLHSKALDLLRYLSDNSGDNDEDAFKGCSTTIRYLQKLNNNYLDVILQYSKWPIEIDINNGVDIFINESIECESLNRFEVLDSLMSYNTENYKLVVLYLENLIYELGEKSSKFHNKLLEIYIGNVAQLCSAQEEDVQGDFFNKCNRLYGASETYDEKLILRILDQHLSKASKGTLTWKRVLLLKVSPLRKMNQYDEILNIFVDSLSDHKSAREFCSSIYEEDSTRGTSLLENLLDRYLSMKPSMDLENVLELLSTNGSRFDITNVLKSLPSDLPLNKLTDFINLKLRSMEKRSQDTKMESSLLKVDIVGYRQKLLMLRNENIVVTSDRTCPVCHKRLGNSVLNAFPNGMVLHYGCSSSMR